MTGEKFIFHPINLNLFTLSGEHSYLTLSYLDNTSSLWQPLFRLLTQSIMLCVKTFLVTGGYQARIHVAPPFFCLPLPFVLIRVTLALPHFSQKP